MQNSLHSLPSLSSLLNRDLEIVDPDMLLIEAISMMNQHQEEQESSADLARLGKSESAWRQFKQTRITIIDRAILIVEGHRLVGIFTQRDWAKLTATQTDLGGIKIGAVMTKDLYTLVLSAEQTAIDALRVLDLYQIHHLPIVDDRGQLLGMVSLNSIQQTLQPADPLQVLRMLGSLQSELGERIIQLEQTNKSLRGKTIEQEQIGQTLRRSFQTLEEQIGHGEAESVLLTRQLQAKTIEQKSTELSLEISQQGISDFIEYAPIGIHLVNSEGITVWVNQAELDMLGYAAEDYRGKPLMDFHVNRPLVESSFRRLQNNEPIRGFEAQMWRKDGSICHVSIDANPLFKDGKFIHARCFTRDISDRKQAEAALWQSERKFRAIFDSAFEFIGLLAVDGIVLEANRTALNAMGSTPTIIGQQFANTRWWNHDPALQLQLQQAIVRAAAGEIVRFESYHILADGRQIDVDFSLSPICDETGKVVLLIPEGRDISERKAGEQKIREQAAMLNVATDAIIVRDLMSKIQFWNDGAELIYGWKATEAIGRNARILFELDDEPTAKIALDTIQQTGVWHGEIHKRTKSGQQAIVESRCSLVYDANGKPESILSVETDITQKKQLEQQFFRVQRLESLGTLATGIAHDLNNILTPILGAAQLLPLTLPKLDDRNQRLLTMLVESSKRGSSLVNQILTFARGTDGQPTVLQVRHILTEIVSVARQTFPKSIEIILALEREDLWMVCVDATQIHQVLMNLFVNARDAMPNGGGITTTAKNVMFDDTDTQQHPNVAAGAYIMLMIADTGIGMDAATLDRIFDSFFTTKEAGTGLGLSTVLGIVKAHGGLIEVDSQPGRGSSFTIHLPATKTRLEEQPTAAPELFDGQGQLVLVVDDEMAIREIAKDSLENYNYHAMLASNGVEALALYAQNWHRIAVVMVDMMMPHLDTPSVIQALQRINPTVKIIIMSGSPTNEGIVEQYGLRAFLTKPFTTIDMMHALADLDPSSTHA